jgi:16S rRNA C967 or C1407 C5-methylase (RsmB/RsmF family)
MGKGNNKRHFKGGNSSEQKRKRKEAADKWKSVRGDAQPGTGTGTGTGSRVSGGKSWVLENDKFDAFYRAQHFIDEGEDWDRFMRHLQTPLPACFRICPDYPFANELRDQMLSYVGHKIEVESGLEIQPAEQLPWYPNGFGYKLGVDRRAIRKLDVLTDLHKWMIRHTDNGNITRQEAVSMVPPLALDVHPHHRCLDMCAAPGSKTTQLLEIVNRSLLDPDPSRRGLVVANDSDTDRAYMLVHQCKRINSPLLVVTTHKGQYFPFIADEASAVVCPCPVAFFDRVLCDVPCSGDGTLRKNPAIWKRWSTSMGMTLHPLQLMIAKRGLQLLKDDCLMVYSTCSMSPYGALAMCLLFLWCDYYYDVMMPSNHTIMAIYRVWHRE